MPKKFRMPSQMPEIQPETLSQIHPARDWMPCHRPRTRLAPTSAIWETPWPRGRDDPRDDLRNRLHDLRNDGREIRNQGHQQFYTRLDDLRDTVDKSVYDAGDNLWDQPPQWW